jgi:3-hydroxy-9,10-secoandrosta-1,3,5(10)-triene-9,17-dione monooxygenase reductase component
LVTLGPIQYVGPAIQFLLGVLLLHNEMSSERWFGFALIGAALVVFVHEGTRAAQRTDRDRHTTADDANAPPREDARPPAIAERRLRHVLAHVPTSVSVVSTMDGPDPVGCTIGTLVSVSLDPPLIAYFGMRSSTTLAAVRRAGTFSVNVLAEDQAEASEVFARTGSDRFHAVRWGPGVTGTPHLDGAVVVLDCDVHGVTTVGDHEMVVGRVTDVSMTRPEADPLVFAGGTLRGLTPVHPVDGDVARRPA